MLLERGVLLIELDGRDAAVSAETDVILAADVDGVLQVLDQILGVRLPGGAQEGHEVDADYAAAIRDVLSVRDHEYCAEHRRAPDNRCA